MNLRGTSPALLLCVSCLSILAQSAQSPSAGVNRDIDRVLAEVIASTRAIDNHAHPVLPPPNDATDRGFDALPVDNMAPQTDPVALRPDYPPLHDAWLALFGADIQPPLTADTQKLLESKRGFAKAREGSHYDEWVLDQAGIGTMIANRVSLPPGTAGMAAPRFRWVPYLDALMFPLDNAALAAETPDRALFFPLEDKVRARYLADLGMKAMPATLDGYVKQVVLPTLQHQHEGGAVAIKFELAYLRDLDIGNPSPQQAAAVYAKYVRAGTPDAAAYKALQDFLFRAMAVEAGRLGMAVHLHCMAGAGSYFSERGVNPLNLEPLFNDPKMRKTNFVLLHGGYPYVHEIGALLLKPNVYLDISQQALIIPARTLATWLREWLELFPEKVLFATDGYPYSPFLGWEESTWLASRNARQALGLALTGIERDGEVTPARAAELARAVLRGNAEALYAFPPL